MRLFVAFVVCMPCTAFLAQLPNSFEEIPSEMQGASVAWFPLLDDYEDISTSPINGTPSGSLTFESNGGPEPFDTYLSFGGGVISLGSPEKLKWPNLVEGAFSVWLRPQNTSGDGRLYSSENPECCNSIEFRDEQSNSNYAGVGFNLIGAYEIVQIPYEDWSHVLVNAEPFGQDSIVVTIYLNNEIYHIENPKPEDTSLPSYGYSDMFIGQKAAPAYDKWRGDAAHMCWFNRPLTEIERTYLFQGGTEPGCTDPTSCNYNADADLPDGSCIPAGCMDEYACNYDAEAGCDDGSCDYSCCPGPGCCSQGMFWDWDSLACFVSKPTDINMDGCVQLDDLLDLLSAYGDCAVVAEWACGDPLEYQGYDYTTIQIGDQCWFAENLRAESYRNEEVIPVGLTNDQWISTSQGAITIYMDEMTGTMSHIYNGYIVQDDRGVCPMGWAVPTDTQLSELEVFAGMSASEMSSTGSRGNHGIHLKAVESDYPGWVGDNLTGFSAQPTRTRKGSTGEISGGGSLSVWSSTGAGDIWLRHILGTTSQVIRDKDNPHNGRSIRCIAE